MRASRCALGALVFTLSACGSSSGSGGTSVGGSSGGGAPASGGTTAVAGSGGSSHATGGSSHGSGGAAGSTAAAGGTAAGGSAGAAGGGPAHVVGACDGLAAVGVWEDITPQTSPAMFVVDPVNAGTVYLGSEDPHRNGIFKTTDCGGSWTHVSTGRNGSAVDSGGQWTMAIDPTHPEVIYTNSGYGASGLFKSTNGGIDWDDVTPKGDGAPGFVGNLQMDPENPNHLLLTWHSNCGNYADGIGCFAETTDGGATWKEHYGNPPFPGQVRVLLLHGSNWVVLADSMLLTRDGGQTYTTVLGTAAGGHSSGTLSRMHNGDYYIGYMYGLIRSPATSDGGQWDVLSNTGSWVGDVVESATTRFSTHQQGPVMTSLASDGVSWKDLANSPHSEFAGYDRDHHVLYACSPSDGKLRRMVTQ